MPEHRLPRTSEQKAVTHLSQQDLADRWRLSPRTLERWRWLKRGPAFLRLGGRIVYRLSDIETFEMAQLSSTQSGPVAR